MFHEHISTTLHVNQSRIRTFLPRRLWLQSQGSACMAECANNSIIIAYFKIKAIFPGRKITCDLYFRLITLSSPASSFAACLFSLAFCHWAKPLKDLFVIYRAYCGKDFSKSAFSFSSIFNSLNFFFSSILNQPSSTNDNKEEGLKEKEQNMTTLLIRSSCFSCMLILSIHKSAIVLIPM